MSPAVAEVSGVVRKKEVLGTIRDLRKAHRALDVWAETETDNFLQALRRGQSYVYRRTAEILAESQFRPDWDYTQKLQWYTENWAAIERVAIAESGYSNATARYVAGYDRLSGMAERTLSAGLPRVPGEMTRIPKEWVDFLKRRDYAYFGFLQEEAIRKLDETILWNVLAGRSPGGLLEELKGVITGEYPWGNKTGLYEWHAGTYARTGHHRAVRSWKAEKAKELGLENYIYNGPVDDKTREFCLEHVGRVYTLKEIEAMDNGQTGDVLVNGGGWNCRHDFDVVDDELAKEVREDQETAEAVKEEVQLPEPVPVAPPPAATPETTEPPLRAFNLAPAAGWQEFKTVKAAEKWATEHNLADTVNFAGLDVRAANEINRNVSAFVREFPEARPNLRFVGSIKGHKKFMTDVLTKERMEGWDAHTLPWLKEQGISAEEIAKRRVEFEKRQRRNIGGRFRTRQWRRVESDALGYFSYHPGHEGIAISDSFWGPRNFNATTASQLRLRQEEARIWKEKGIGGYKPPNAYRVEHTIGHECGHLMDYTKKLQNDPFFIHIRDTWTYEEIRDTICGYAADYYVEVFSSLYEEYCANGFTAAGMRPKTRRLFEAMCNRFGVTIER